MSKYKFFTFCTILFFLFPFGAVAAPDVKVFVRSETVGSEIIYYYLLTRNGPEEIRGLGIGVQPAGDYKCNSYGRCGGNYTGTLKVMPSGTTWGPNPNIMVNREFPKLSAGSTTQPSGWTATVGPGRAPGESGAKGLGLAWSLPPWDTTYPTTFVQKSTYQFSVRVPAGPISTAEYMNGFFTVQYRYLDMDHNFYAPMKVVDVTFPTIAITAPTAGSILQPGVRTVSATASDDVGVLGVQFRLNNTNIGSEVTAQPYSFSWDTTPFFSGTYTLTATARDTDSNITVSKEVPITINGCPDCNLPYGEVGKYYPRKTVVENVWVTKVKVKSGTIPPGMELYLINSDGISPTALQFGGIPTTANKKYTFTLEIWISKIGGGTVNYLYPTYSIEIVPPQPLSSPPPPPLPVGIPSFLTVPTTNGNGIYQIFWGAADGAVQRYQLQEATSANFLVTTIVFDGYQLSKDFWTAQSGTYYYRVRACSASTDNSCSAYQTANNNLVITFSEDVPSSVTVPTTNTTGFYTISWGAAAGTVTHYELQEGTEPSFTCYMPPCQPGRMCIQMCQLVPTVWSGNSLSANIGSTNSIAPGKPSGTYYYRVRACNGEVCSIYRAGANGVTVTR